MQFEDMVRRCNAAGVNIIADFVVNHMSGHGMSGTGTGGSSFNGGSEDYPGVPYSNLDFHQPYCEIHDYHVRRIRFILWHFTFYHKFIVILFCNSFYFVKQNVDEVRNCYLVSLNDLNGGKDYVRDKIAGYANDMLALGKNFQKLFFAII